MKGVFATDRPERQVGKIAVFCTLGGCALVVAGKVVGTKVAACRDDITLTC